MENWQRANERGRKEVSTSMKMAVYILVSYYGMIERGRVAVVRILTGRCTEKGMMCRKGDTEMSCFITVTI